METFKKSLIAAAIILAAGQAVPAHAGVNFNLSIGLPVAVAAVPPPPPIPVPPRVVMEAAPGFFFSPSLGFYVSVGRHADIFFTGGNYYRFDRGYWYRSTRCNGPWAMAPLRGLPPELTRHRYEQIRYYKERDYRHYMEARHHGHDKEWNDFRSDRHDHDRGKREQDARWHGERGM
ncbi:MAG TPA: hypothetical protein VMC44_03910 [Geobacteraceae bacterium]|nr:hypothetical protein [Geobacteraceae bacterium]